MAKRKPGDGSIRLRKDGRWEGRAVIGYDEKGLPKTKNVLAKTKTECIAKLNVLKEEISTNVPEPKPDLTFGEWMDFWYRTYSKPHLRSSTAQEYESNIYKHIIPALGKTPLTAVTTEVLEKFYTHLKTDGRITRRDQFGPGLSDKSVRECALCCKAALEQAVRDGLLRKNPAADCKLPPKKAKEIRTLTKAEIARLLCQAKEEGFYEMFLLDLFTGLRRGELVGLRWEDLDFTTGELRVQRQIHPANGECVPKTKASVRTIVLPVSIIKLLEDTRKTTDSRWMFPSPVKEDSPRDPTACRKALSRILKRSGCQHVPFHAVRHTFAELCLEGGMDIKTLSATLGHQSVSTSLNVYSHVNNRMREQAARKIDRRVARTGDCDSDEPEADKTAEVPVFTPYKGKIRRRGTGCVTRINDGLWEGRYSPRNKDGTRACHTVYAKSEEECEAMLAEMIAKVKGERKGSPTS
ncbi:MAG: site-specific integrase [Oscillospiraceae bacterium]|nr:site-specific integrase [Oscillospiraceae bacterium]